MKFKETATRMKSTSGADLEKIEETYARILGGFSRDPLFAKEAEALKRSESQNLIDNLKQLKQKKESGFSAGDVESVLSARAWVESLDRTSDLDKDLKMMVDDLGLEIVNQFGKAKSAVRINFGNTASLSQSPDDIRKAKEVVKDPFFRKVADWKQPFHDPIFNKVRDLAKQSLPLPKPAAPALKPAAPAPKLTAPAPKPAAPAPKPAAPAPKPATPATKPAAPAPKPATPAPKPTAPAPKPAALHVESLPQPRVAETTPVYKGESCPNQFLQRAKDLQKASSWKGKEALTEADAQQLTQYIEANRATLVNQARSSPNGSIFIPRGHSRLPRSLQVSIEDGKPQFYILLKSGLRGRKERIGILGKGGAKTVKVGTCYGDETEKPYLVASAAIGYGKTALDEYAKQKHFGAAKSACRLVNSKGEDTLHIVMPLANMGEMDGSKFKELTEIQRKQYLLSAAGILSKMHASGYVSSDVKPQNLLGHIDDKGRCTAVMTDHGTTIPIGSQYKDGTRDYLSYEMTFDTRALSRYKVAPAQDVWAFGITLWQLTHEGKMPPFRPNNPFKYADRHQNAKLDTDLERLCHAMLNPHADKRPDMAQIIKSLENL
ncbi:MAG: protein kinase [Chlamydiia bacterium]|nr:protein kinase [Chlamydiia bacterium]